MHGLSLLSAIHVCCEKIHSRNDKGTSKRLLRLLHNVPDFMLTCIISILQGSSVRKRIAWQTHTSKAWLDSKNMYELESIRKNREPATRFLGSKDTLLLNSFICFDGIESNRLKGPCRMRSIVAASASISTAEMGQNQQLGVDLSSKLPSHWSCGVLRLSRLVSHVFQKCGLMGQDICSFGYACILNLSNLLERLRRV